MGEGYGGSMRDLRSAGGKGTAKDGATMVIDLSSPSKPYLLLSSSKTVAPRGQRRRHVCRVDGGDNARRLNGCLLKVVHYSSRDMKNCYLFSYATKYFVNEKDKISLIMLKSIKHKSLKLVILVGHLKATDGNY